MLVFNKSGGSGGAQPPPPVAGGRGAPPPHLANVLAFPPRKSFGKRFLTVNSSANNYTREIKKYKCKVSVKVKVKEKSHE